LPPALSQPFEDRFHARTLLACQFEVMPDQPDTALPVLRVEHVILGLTYRTFQVVEVCIDKMKRMHAANWFCLLNTHRCPKKRSPISAGKFDAVFGGRMQNA
jgi:hypothetical protein